MIVIYNRDRLENFQKSLIECMKKASDLALKPSRVLKTNQEVYFQLKEDLGDFLIFKIILFLHLLFSSFFLVSCIYSP